LTAADVFCRSFNPRFGAVSWTNATALPYTRAKDFYDGYQKPILMDDVSCTGNEDSLNQCSYKSVSNCYHGEDVIVTCSGASNFTTRGNYRLANPKNETHYNGTGVWGRVEVFNGTKWNQICNVDFTKNNAIVICRSLGLPVNYVGFTNAQNVATSL
jgi:hypothetical protein